MLKTAAYALTITHPSNGTSCKLPIEATDLPRRNGAPRTLRLTLRQNVGLFATPGSTNPLAYNSKIVVTRTTTSGQNLFIGYVVRINTVLQGDAPQFIEIECACVSAKLEKCVGHYGGQISYERRAPIVELTATLKALIGAGGFDSTSLYPVYPAYSATATPDSASPWVSRADSRSTTLGEDIDDTVDTFEVANGREVTAPCFLECGSELMHCSRVYYSGGIWRAANVIRGQLGSTAAAHTSGDPIYIRELKPIADVGNIVMASGTGTIPREKYELWEAEGAFQFKEVFAGFAAPVVATYSVYDIDHATDRLTLDGLVTDLLTASRASGGPGIAGGDIDTTGCDTILIPRFVVDSRNSIMTGPLIRQAIDETWGRRGATTRKNDFFYSAINGKWTLISHRQAGTASVVFPAATQSQQEYTLDGLPERVIVDYETTEPTDLLSTERMYHPSVGDAANIFTSGSTTVEPVTYIMYQEHERALATGWQQDATAGNNRHTELLLDGNIHSGWGLRFGDVFWTSGEPGTNVLAVWGPGATPQILEWVSIIFDARLYIPANNFFELEVYGVDAYTPGDPPTLGNEIPLGLVYRIEAFTGQVGVQGPPRHLLRNVPGERLQ